MAGGIKQGQVHDTCLGCPHPISECLGSSLVSAFLIQLSVNAPENQGVTAQYSAAHTGDPDGISVYCCQPGSSLTLEDIGE